MIKGLNKGQVEESRKLHGDNIIHEANQKRFGTSLRVHLMIQ